MVDLEEAHLEEVEQEDAGNEKSIFFKMLFLISFLPLGIGLFRIFLL